MCDWFISTIQSLSNDRSPVSMDDHDDDESISSLANHMMHIDNNNDMDDNAIVNNSNEEGNLEVIHGSQPSVMRTNNDGEPIKCSVPLTKKFDEQLKRSIELS
ncbi:hypothetical protein INT45_013100 [Circinella minor]|uniref:Uncharacterized protein n=1 Tax=Circinella minor TaxID=1195481 RepID=A0A8H7RR96_9FUNG|nr:hypothetical protein INT45_013100 [Circinella minor]